MADRRAPTRGSTIASTALVQYEIDTPLVELKRKIGAADAVRAWRRSRLAVSSLSAFLRERGLEAQARNALYLAGNRLGPRALRREAELRQAAGLETLFLERARVARAGSESDAAPRCSDTTISPSIRATSPRDC